MMTPEQVLLELRSDVKALHGKLDASLLKSASETAKNTTDIAWLKKGSFGSVFAYLGALAWLKFGG